MTSQFYRLVSTWEDDEWEFDTDQDTLQRLNKLLPKGYSLNLVMLPHGFVIQLYEYVGDDLDETGDSQ